MYKFYYLYSMKLIQRVQAWSLWKEGKAMSLVDSSLLGSCSPNEALRCIHIGLLCVQDNPNSRPLMSSVVFMLENEAIALSVPKQPVYFSQRYSEAQETGVAFSFRLEYYFLLLFSKFKVNLALE